MRVGSSLRPRPPLAARTALGHGLQRPSRRPEMVLQALRGGQSLIASLQSGSLTISRLYNSSFVALAIVCLVLQLLGRAGEGGKSAPALKPAERSLRNRFLVVFWAYKMADWLQGPYFYDVYASKIINGVRVSADGVAKLFLAGFGSTMLVGPFVGGAVDSLGRKKASLAFALAYTVGALSTTTSSLPLLYTGRFFGGVGTSLLFSAPEAWLIAEGQKSSVSSSMLSQTFGLAFLGDSVVAMLAGQLAGGVAAKGGPTAPFVLSTAFLAAGALAAALTWGENSGSAGPAEGKGKKGAEAKRSPDLVGRVGRAWAAMLADRKIMLVGAIQAFFEGAMYTFVLVWPPAVRAAIAALGSAAESQAVPFGAIFSCFMACCMVGSSVFSAAMRTGLAVESVVTIMLALGFGAMSLATVAATRHMLLALTLAFFVFEACVGAYFPCISTLRSRLLPDEHRGAIMNLFGIPLNLIVVVVFLSIAKLGTVGALKCSTGALGCAAVTRPRRSPQA